MCTKTAHIETKSGKRGIVNVIDRRFTNGQSLVTVLFKDGIQDTYNMEDLNYFSYQSN